MNHDSSQERVRRELAQRTQRRSMVQDQLLSLQIELHDLDREIEELEIADRVLSRVAPPVLTLTTTVDTNATANIAEIGKRKPDDLPTIPEMINMALLASEKDGAPALSPKEVLKRIRANWWPTAEMTDISPTMARLAKKGKLRRTDDSKYVRVSTNSASSSLNGAGE